MDMLNPKYICLNGSDSFRAGPPRRCVYTGERYIRHSRSTPIDDNQIQQIYGHYQNLDTEETHQFRFTWRPVFPSQVVDMLKEAGFSHVNLYSDSHRSIEFQDESQHIFVEAIV